MGFGLNNNISEGSQFVTKPAVNNNSYWLRSNDADINSVKVVFKNGNLGADLPTWCYHGIAPVIVLK